MLSRWFAMAVVFVALAACGDSTGEGIDSSVPDSGAGDSAPGDAGDTSVTDTSIADSGADADTSIADSGTVADSGTDAGAGFPLDHAFPATSTGATITRLGNDVFVIAYTDDVDTSTGEGEELVLQRVVRTGHGLVFDPPERFTQTSIAPTSDNPLRLIGSLGEAHFFVIVGLPGYTHVTRYFKVVSGSFVDIGSATYGGTDFGGPPAFFQGHPVDATRYLLGYREDNSGQPVQYRLIIRDADSFSLGAPVTRPPPSAFTGLSTSESQADPALVRMGPTTFVEARPGYVHPPGNLATWTLEVAAGNTLAVSDPRVHATLEGTMNPEVAADGRGGALIAYHTYTETDWSYGIYDHSTGALTETAVFAVSSDDSSIRAFQGESTDGFLGGWYYLRLPGTSAGDAPLFRIDAGDGTVERLVDVPNLLACYRAPQVVRTGTIAAYLGCDRVKFVDLLPLCGNSALDDGEACDDGNNDDGDTCTAGCTVAP